MSKVRNRSTTGFQNNWKPRAPVYSHVIPN
uniref:Uncharacterized protein n=1 Tax=Rhizophora mucronata TaxID=61149 RepID=A0A2P2QYN7_RHIMU